MARGTASRILCLHGGGSNNVVGCFVQNSASKPLHLTDAIDQDNGDADWQADHTTAAGMSQSC